MVTQKDSGVWGLRIRPGNQCCQKSISQLTKQSVIKARPLSPPYGDTAGRWPVWKAASSGKALVRTLSCRHLDLGLPASRSVRKYISVVHATRSRVFGVALTSNNFGKATAIAHMDFHPVPQVVPMTTVLLCVISLTLWSQT